MSRVLPEWRRLDGLATVIQALIQHGLVEDAYLELVPMVRRVQRSGGFFEWFDRRQPSPGLGHLRGRRGVLGKAISCSRPGRGRRAGEPGMPSGARKRGAVTAGRRGVRSRPGRLQGQPPRPDRRRNSAVLIDQPPVLHSRFCSPRRKPTQRMKSRDCSSSPRGNSVRSRRRASRTAPQRRQLLVPAQ